MVKVYYSYQFERPIGQFASRNCNFCVNLQKKIIVSGSCQYIAIISLKNGEVIKYLYKENKNTPVRHIKLTQSRIYAGYEDGSILVWDINTYEILHSLDLHKSTVSSITLSEDEVRLISAGLDGNIIIWDLLSQENQEIKSAHANAITQIEYTTIILQGKPTNIIFSTAKDGFLKIWNADTKLCLSVISTQTTEALALQYSPERNLVYVGTNKEDVLLIKINSNASNYNFCQVVATFKRKNFTKCQQMIIEYNQMYILTDKKIQVYELLSDQKLKQKKKRVLSRKKNKQQEQLNQNQEVQINQYQLHILPLQQKTLLQKSYNIYCQQSHLYLNNGINIIQLPDTSLTHSNNRTLQLELTFPFLIQRNPQNLQIYNYGSFNHLFSIPVKAHFCSLFNNGFLLIVQQEQVSLWDLAKNQSIYTLNQKWTGCWARKNKCLLWRENELGIFQIGKDKKGKTKIRASATKFFEDKITYALYFPNFEKYASNLQNSQIHIQYADTNKNFLKLYGHKLPINSFDISSDSALLASGSTDKDIRFWDLDFGHSIKTVFAHSQAVTAVKFLHETHYLISGSKDGHIKFWDGDSHQLIMDLEENILEIRSLAVTTSADYIIAGGFDGGFRIWKQTNNQIIAGDQQEKNMEKVMIEQYANQKFKENQTKTRYQDLKYGEQIIEALENSEQPAVLIKLLKDISPSNLKSSLSFLHSFHIQKLRQYLRLMIEHKHQIEICWRVLEALDRGTNLGKPLRQHWQNISKMLSINREGLNLLLRNISQSKSLGM